MIDIELQRARSAMAESVTLPIAMWLEALDELEVLRQTRLVQQAEQEPVAWLNESEGVDMYAFSWRKKDGFDTPLYTAPVRTKDLTDDELLKIIGGETLSKLQFARAVIAADREKNRG